MDRETREELEKKIEEEKSGIISEQLKQKTLAAFDMRDYVFRTVTNAVMPGRSPDKYFRFMHDVGIYHTTDNVLIRTAIGKKWAKKYNYDYDASLMSSIIMYEIILPEGSIEPLSEDEYKICYKGIEYRGDTMNSWWITLKKFLQVFGGDYFQTAELNEKIEYCEIAMDFLSNPANYRKTLPSYITHFLNAVYTIGNFIPVPIAFNSPRGRGGSKDYWDLALMSIFNYYHNDHKNSGDGEISLYWLLQNNQKYTDECEQWLNIFGKGEDGWRHFVEKNFLQDFVNQNPDGGYGPPKALWDGHSKDHVLPSEEEEFRSFFTNASAWIMARGTRMMIALDKQMTEKENSKENI